MSTDVYTDGGCSGNPGPGAWAFVVVSGETHHADSGTSAATTNNRMELSAVIAALRYLSSARSDRPLRVTTDSQYVKQGITDWIRKWERNGWVTSAKKPVKNRDLWEALGELNRELAPEWHWVRGHDGHRYNEECDLLVQSRIREVT